MAATLVIGVGGTGTQVLVQVHERLIRDYGRVPRHVGLVAIDARDWPEVSPFPAKLPFTSTEPINYMRTWPQFSDELSAWWPDRVPKGNPEINFTKGCGAIRANGRFFAFYYANKIEATLRQALNTMRAADPHGPALEQDLSVIICGSLGNGTGGGTFMDIAAMSRKIAGQMFATVRVSAMSLASTVTMVGNANDLRVRVAANGLAALIETQHEFNRLDRGGEDVARPYDPYVFRAWNGTQVARYEADSNVPPTRLVPPLDFVYIFEEYDRAGQRHDFKSLRKAMAEGITALCGSSDAGMRELDGRVQAGSGSRRFGSLCAIRLVVPQADLAEFVLPEMALHAMDVAVSTDLATWSDLLDERLPSGEAVMAARGATVETSVNAFVEHVLGIREVGSKTRPSSDINQVLDRFKPDEESLRNDVSRAAEALGASDSPAAISNNARALVSVVEDQLEKISAEWQRLLVNGPDSLWLREPADPTQPVEAGVRWLINWRVRRFAQAGAFGLLAEWLSALGRHIDENKRSVEESEIKMFLDRFDFSDRAEVESALGRKDFAAALQRISSEADSFLARLKLQRLRNEAAKLREEAELHVELAVVHSKTRESIRFYDQVLDHVSALTAAAHRVSSRLGQEGSRLPLQDLSRQAIRRLERMTGERSNTDDGQPTELALAGTEEMRRDLIEALRTGVATAPRAILASINATNMAFLANELSPDRVKAAGASLDLLSGVGDFDLYYRRALLEAVRKTTDQQLNALCDVDRVLEAESLAMTRRYEEAFVKVQGALSDRVRGLLQAEIEERYGKSVFEYIRSLDWVAGPEKARRQAVPALIAGLLFRYLSYAAPHWGIQHSARDAAKLARFAFFNYAKQSEVLGRAVAAMEDLKLLKAGEGHVHPVATSTSQSGRIDILSVDIGADLNSLTCVGQLQESYEKAVSMDDFSPHLTKQYESVGRAWLQNRLPEPPGATLLLLAQHVGIVEEKSGGNFSLAVEILSKRTEDGDAVAWSGRRQGYQLPRGLVQSSDWLDGDKQDAQELKAALKHLCWERLEARAATTRGWDSVADDLNRFAAESRDRESQWGKHIAVVKAACAALEALSHELKDSKGSVKPRILR